jgi:hypothetical protein
MCKTPVKRTGAFDAMTTSTGGPSDALVSAIEELWRIPPPGPSNLFSDPAFVRLYATCRRDYFMEGHFGDQSALSNALRALGLPCGLPSALHRLAGDPAQAALRLDEAFRTVEAKRLYLVPLDMAAGLPPISFGRARIARFTADELGHLFDAERLRRTHPALRFDAQRFSEFQWLIVEECVQFASPPGNRALPLLTFDFSGDLGRIEPHEGRYPAPVEEALFFLLTAPWEQWAETPEVDWRGFRVPWVYIADEDLFVRAELPQSPDTLSWDERYDDYDGEVREYEVPLELRLGDEATDALPAWGLEYWNAVVSARGSSLFETPIAHFLVRAFSASDIDEFLGHITTIEAALGLPEDYESKLRPADDPYRKIGAGRRMRARIAALLEDPGCAVEFTSLFRTRSLFLHGRPMAPISTQERVLARSLARRVVVALIQASHVEQGTRGDFLAKLLAVGMPVVPPD